MTTALKVDSTNDDVVGRWRGSGAIPGNTADTLTFQCTTAEHAQAADNRHPGGQIPRWKFVGSPRVLVEQADLRPLLRFVFEGDSTETGPVVFEDEQSGGAPYTLTSNALVRGSKVVDTTFNGNITIAGNGKKARLNFTFGVASINVIRNRVQDLEFASNPSYEAEDTVSISVIDSEL